MFFLPETHGHFAVGATTFVAPVRPARAVGSSKLRNSKSNPPEPALYLEEVAFTAYYPADTRSAKAKKGLDWVIRPVKESLYGFASFTTLPRWVLWPVIYLLGTLVKIPVYPNAPLLRPAKVRPGIEEDVVDSQWPLVIFSHGLGGSRTAYSQICSRLASSGKVILAIEHRDGTGHACMPRSWVTGGRSKPRPVLYYQDDDIVWHDGDVSNNPAPLPLRTDQLAFRHEELYITYHAFCRLIQNDPSLEIGTIDGAEIDRQSWSLGDDLSGKGPVCHTENVSLAGHSFGGCTVLSILSTRPPSEHMPIPIRNALVLDPWLEPLPSPGSAPFPSTRLFAEAEVMPKSVPSTIDETVSENVCHASEDRDSKLPRVLVLNSEVFTLWKDHFVRLQEVIEAWEPQGQRIVTLIGSQHASFSDFPSLPLIKREGAQTLMDTIAKLSAAFLDGEIEQALDAVPARKMEVEIVGTRKDGRPKRRLVGDLGDVIVL